MRVLLENRLTGKPGVEVSPDVYTEMPLAGGCLRLEWTHKESLQTRVVWVNQSEMPLSSGETESGLAIPCLFDHAGNMTLRIQGERGECCIYRFYRNPQLTPAEEQSAHLADFRDRLLPLFAGCQMSSGTLFQAIESRRLPLLALLQPKTGEDEGCLLEIEAALPHLLHVCKRPHTRLRDDEQVRPVGAVRRTGPATLQHIASHSEHWEARTLRGLRPARLLARTVTDDLELYENRVVFCLLGKLRRHIHSLLEKVMEARKQRQIAFDLKKLSEDPFFYRRWELLERLFGKDNLATFGADQERFELYARRLLAIQNMLAQCSATSFYDTLKRSKPVSSPLQSTNILQMDPHYGPLFRLWRTLDDEQMIRQQALDGAKPQECQTLYGAFCQVVVLEALRQSGFVAANEEIALRSVRKHSTGDCFLTISAAARFRNKLWSVAVDSTRDDGLLDYIRLCFRKDLEFDVRLPSEVLLALDLPADIGFLVERRGDFLRFHDRPSSEQFVLLEKLLRPSSGMRPTRESREQAEAWRRFVNELRQRIRLPETFELLLIPVFTRLGHEVEDVGCQTKWLLDNAVKQKLSRRVDTCVMLLPETVLNSEPDSTILPWELLRRTNTRGDTFSAGDALRWGNYATGMLTISQKQVVSVTRLARLFRTHMLLHEMRSGSQLAECPVCGQSDAMAPLKGGRDGFECHRCIAMWNSVKCPSCEHNYSWIRPGEKTHQQARKLLNGLSPDIYQKYEQWMNILEHLEGDGSCCGFCEATDIPFTPICPKCGDCSQSTSKRSACQRCVKQQPNTIRT